MHRRDFIKTAAISVAASFVGRKLSYANAFQGRKIILGASTIVIRIGGTVGAQIDRVIRDVAWTGSKYDQRKNPNDFISDRNSLVPYMEGRLSGQLIEYAQVKVIGLSPSVARKRGDEYYAKDVNGGYSLRVDPSKTVYPTVKHTNSEMIEMVDTHGFNTLVEPVMHINKSTKLDVVLACMDLPSKAQAALQLARLGINCFGPCDRFASDLMGYRHQPGVNAIILGTAPIRPTKNGAIIGGQQVLIAERESIVVQTTQKSYPDQYCDTASRYFKRLGSVYNLDLDLTEIEASVGETEKLVSAANASRSSVIGARVYNQEDVLPLQAWLDRNKQNRLILFHSAPYESGYEMFFKYPLQTSFGDLDPIVIG